jgi:hypothetical protein
MTQAQTAHEDLTSQAKGLEPHEKLYRSASGYIVLVGVEASQNKDKTTFHFKVTSSLRDADGSTVMIDGKPHEGPPHHITVHPHSDTDIAATIEDARLLCVSRIERAEINRAGIEALAHVKITA